VSGQVGLRCKHCYKKPQEHKNQRKSCRDFPRPVYGIYQAAQNIYHFHFKNGCCPCMPPKIMSDFQGTTPSRSCYGGGKQYWIIAAESLDLVESASGLQFKSAPLSRPNKDIDTCTSEVANLDSLLNDAARNENLLVNPEDRNLVTDYIFMIMCQMVQFPTKKEKNDTNHSNPRLVLCCKHCNGQNGKGIFNRTKVTSISKNEYFNQVHSHLASCSHCPENLKKALKHLKTLDDVQKRKLKRGNRKEFFNRILHRMSLS
jgi:hypothetical protein